MSPADEAQAAGQLIDGAWQHGEGHGVVSVHDPGTGDHVASYAHATDRQVALAAAASRSGFEAWRRTSPHERGRILQDCANLIRARGPALAQTLATETGKPLAQARAEVEFAASSLAYDAAEAVRVFGRVIRSDIAHQEFVIHEPIGPVAAFVAWNFPTGTLARKFGSILAAGCSALLVTTPETPGSCVAMLRCFVDAGVPNGVVGLLTGDPAQIADALVSHPAIRALTLTGSPQVGRVLGGLAAAHLKPTVLELGGHSPVIVEPDVDVDALMRALVLRKFGDNAGQICVSPTRFLVHRKIVDRFTDSMVTEAQSLRVGHSTAPGTQLGPMISDRRRAAVHELIEDAVLGGAQIACGGRPLERSGYFYSATVLRDVPSSARAMREEPFGPLALIQSYDDLDAAIATANATPYALAAYAFTGAAAVAQRLTHELDCGYLAINHVRPAPLGMPFGGNRDSGHGREGGPVGLRAFTTLKLVSQDWS